MAFDKTRFYFDFEQRFRGGREEIQRRLTAYVPLLSAMEAKGFALDAIDLGCGRGEWLELLAGRGWNALGIDFDGEMLKPAEMLALRVVTADATQYVKDLPDRSVDLVTGFHIVEHLQTDVLIELLHDCTRIVRPGGLIIFETPNPENFRVGSNTFYLDPTHVSPLPPLYLEFVANYVGFERAFCIGLNAPVRAESSELAAAFLRNMNIFPDYALVAQSEPTDDCFDLAQIISESYSENVPYAYVEVDKLAEKLKQLEHMTDDNARKLADLHGRLEIIEHPVKFLRLIYGKLFKRR